MIQCDLLLPAGRLKNAVRGTVLRYTSDSPRFRINGIELRLGFTGDLQQLACATLVARA